jgi:hypothetical protein
MFQGFKTRRVPKLRLLVSIEQDRFWQEFKEFGNKHS